MLRRLVVLVAVVIALLVGAAALYLREGPGKRLGIVGLRLEAPFTLAADSLIVEDEQGVWLKIERPLISWRPRMLLVGTVDIPRLEAARIQVARWPEGEASAGQTPSLPLEVRLGHVELPIEAPGLSLRLEGAADLRDALLQQCLADAQIDEARPGDFDRRQTRIAG